MNQTNPQNYLKLSNGQKTPIRNKTAYISGPITGIVDLNRPAFEHLESILTGKGYKVVNPHKLHDPNKIETWDHYMRVDVEALLKCGFCVMLPGWQNSTGAIFEYITAETLNIPVIDIDFTPLITKKHELYPLFDKLVIKMLETSNIQYLSLE